MNDEIRNLLPEMPGQDEIKRHLPKLVHSGSLLEHVKEHIIAMHVSHIAHDLQSDNVMRRDLAQDRVEKLLPYMAPKKTEVKVTHDHGSIAPETADALAEFLKQKQAIRAEYEVEGE